MANADRPRGAECQGECLRANRYVADEAIYPGDFVNANSSGKVEPADASEALLGVALGYASADGESIMIADHPAQRYILQADGSDIDAQTDFNLNFNIVATAGNSTYKLSRMELDSDSGATTATLPLKLLDYDIRPDNALGAQVDCIVEINNHQLKGGTGTVGT
jgi:hypothetical protein